MEDQVTIRLPGKLLRELTRRAKDLGVPKSHVVREALATYMARPQSPPTESAWERVKEMAGSLEIDQAAVEADDIASRIRQHNWRKK